MLYAAFVFLIISVISGALGFTGISNASAGIAKGIFVLFFVLFLIALLVAIFILA